MSDSGGTANRTARPQDRVPHSTANAAQQCSPAQEKARKCDAANGCLYPRCCAGRWARLQRGFPASPPRNLRLSAFFKVTQLALKAGESGFQPGQLTAPLPGSREAPHTRSGRLCEQEHTLPETPEIWAFSCSIHFYDSNWATHD